MSDRAEANVVSGQSSEVNHPAHYTFGKIEVIDAIEDWGLGYHLGNAVKYIARSAHKGSECMDLEKAIWYLTRYVDKKYKRSVADRARVDKHCDLR